MEYYLVDVFSKKPMSGNGLAVVFPDKKISKELMQRITQEFRQFETIFIEKDENHIYDASVFTVEEELPFAGHPILGATACIHQKYFEQEENSEILIRLSNRTLSVSSSKTESGFIVTMNQGNPEFIGPIDDIHIETICQALNLKTDYLSKTLPLEVVSTGLPYLIVPLSLGIENAKITIDNFEDLLSKFKAKFVYVFDENKLICRTWDNKGLVEDIATGSAAGPLGAYLVKHKIKNANTEFILFQGEFAHRPSRIKVIVQNDEVEKNVLISGDVSFFAEGKLMLEY